MFPKVGYIIDHGGQDDDRPLLHVSPHHTPGPEVFFLSDDQPLVPDQVANEGPPSVLVSCDAARTWPVGAGRDS